VLADRGYYNGEEVLACEGTGVNRAGFAGGSNFQIGWSHHEQDDQQIFT
jgi:hypothetical protein